MVLKLTAETQAALDLAKQAVPEGGELDIGLLLASLYHGTPLKERLPPGLGKLLPPPAARRAAVPERVPVAEPLQALLAELLNRSAAVTPEALFAALLDSAAAPAWLLAQGLTPTELQALRDCLPAAARPATGWRASLERQAAIAALNSYGRMLTASEPPYKGVHGMEKTLEALTVTLSKMGHRREMDPDFWTGR